MTPRKFVGTVLLARRNEVALTQAEVGNILDVSTTTISMIERGVLNIPFPRIHDYVQVYELSEDCCAVFIKLLYPSEWHEILVMMGHSGEDWKSIDEKVDLVINEGNFR